MAREIYYTAVDIGSSKVCSIVSRVGSEGELKILGTGLAPSQGVLKGRIENINEVQAAVKTSLEEAQRYIGRGVISGVYAGVSGVHISCVNTKEMLDTTGDMDDVTPSRIEQLIESSFPTARRAQ